MSATPYIVFLLALGLAVLITLFGERLRFVGVKLNSIVIAVAILLLFANVGEPNIVQGTTKVVSQVLPTLLLFILLWCGVLIGFQVFRQAIVISPRTSLLHRQIYALVVSSLAFLGCCNYIGFTVTAASLFTALGIGFISVPVVGIFALRSRKILKELSAKGKKP